MANAEAIKQAVAQAVVKTAKSAILVIHVEGKA